MAITSSFDPIYEGSRALEFFTDRCSIIRAYTTRLNEAKDEKMLFLSGDGGNGKSLLISYLRLNCSKIFEADDWLYMKSLHDEDFVTNLVDSVAATAVPVVNHDFSLPGSQVPAVALFDIRRKLSGQKLRFPLFDYGATMFLHKLKKPVKETFQLPAEELDFIAASVDALSKSSYATIAKAFLQAIFKSQRDSLDLWMKRQKLDEEIVERIGRLDAERELLPELPRLLAEDLNTSLEIPGGATRLALFFDTHEAFCGSVDQPVQLCSENEKWFRDLLRCLDLRRITAVVAGRE